MNEVLIRMRVTVFGERRARPGGLAACGLPGGQGGVPAGRRAGGARGWRGGDGGQVLPAIARPACAPPPAGAASGRSRWSGSPAAAPSPPRASHPVAQRARLLAPLAVVLPALVPLLPVTLAPAPAAAQRPAPDPSRPHAAERAWVEACILAALAHPPRAAFGRCAWRIAATCQGEPGEGLLIARLPPLPDRPQSPRICALVETAIWQQQLDRWQRELGLLATGAALEALRRAQRAFPGYRELACAAEAALAPEAEAEANRISCRLEQTALRALELKRLRDERILAIAAASVEGP